MRARASVHRRTPQTMIMATATDDAPPIPTDRDKPDRGCVTAVSLGSAVQLQLRLGSGSDDNDHDGDDEQDYNRDDDDDDDPERSLSPSRSDSPVPLASTPPVLHQQQPQPTPTPTTNAYAAHVHFHSRVRITSGLRRSRGNRTLGESSDSDSPSSSISAPLHYHSRSTVPPRVPLTERVSRLASQALQKRRISAMASSATTASRRFRTRDHQPEYTPFLRAGVPVTYGTAQRGYYGVVNDVDSEDENSRQLDDLRGEDGIGFRTWPWRALNRQWWKWQIESTLCCCCSDESDNEE